MPQQTIANGESKLSVRTNLNSMLTELYTSIAVLGGSVPSQETIANGESKLSVRTALNAMFTELYAAVVALGGSAASHVTISNGESNPNVRSALNAMFTGLYAQAASLTGSIGSNVNYDFTGGSLPGGVTLTRGSSATRINASGALVTETTNVARFEYNPVTLAPLGIVIEPALTNPLLRSDAFDNASWSKSGATVTADATFSPDGTANADKIDVGAASTGVYQLVSQSVSVGNVVRLSVSLRASAPTDVVIGLNGQTNGSFNRGQVVSLTTEWQRFTFSYTATGTDTGLYCCVASTNWSVAGGSVTVSGARTVYAFGAQLEIGSKTTSYIRTTSGSASRSADALSFTIPGGVTTLRYVFDNNTTHDLSVSPGSYTVPTTLARNCIKRIVDV